MVYIVSTLLRKALERFDYVKQKRDLETLWKILMLLPEDYGADALDHPTTKTLIKKIEFVHGGPEYDSKYPEGIPTSISIKTKASPNPYESGLIMFPGGHSKNTSVNLNTVLSNKFAKHGKISLKKHDYLNLIGGLAIID
jgi:2-methylcitrate dehydratase